MALSGVSYMSNLLEKLIEVQSELKAPKGQFNSFSNFNYRSAEDILEAVKPLNVSRGLLLTLTDEPVLIGDWHYIKATATITDGTDSHVINAYARESENKKGMDHSQITGAASSYARKYALNGLYLIDDTKDADTDQYHNQNNRPNNKQQNKQKANVKMVTSQQVGSIQTKAMEFAEIRNGNVQDVYNALKKIANVDELNKLSHKQATAYLSQLDKWLANAKKSDKK